MRKILFPTVLFLCTLFSSCNSKPGNTDNTAVADTTATTADTVSVIEKSAPGIKALTSCTYTSGNQQWDITGAGGNPDPTKITFDIVKTAEDTAPYVKIKYNDTVVQCLPAETKRNWRVWYNADNQKWYFKDEASTATLTPFSGPRYALKYTGHETMLKLKLDKSTDSPAKIIFIGTDDYRNASSTAYNDHVFNIHNTNATNTNSVHVVMQKISGTNDYTFTILHNSNLPTSLPSCAGDGTAPQYGCVKAH